MRANLWKLQAFAFFHSLIFAYVIERLYGLSRGLDVRQMVWLEILYAACALLLEVPSGALADRWSRRNTLVLSALCVVGEYVALIQARGFSGFALAALAAAAAGALASGTDNALLYDTLQALGRAADFERLLGRIRLWGTLAGLLAALGGARLADSLGLVAPYWASLPAVMLCLLLSLGLQEPPRSPTGERIAAAEGPPLHRRVPGGAELTRQLAAYGRHMGAAMAFVLGQRALALMVLSATLLGAVFVYADEYCQLLLQAVGVPVGWFGLWAALYMGGEALATSQAWRLRAGLSPRGLLTSLLLLSGTGLLLAGQLRTIWGLLPLLAALAGIWLSQPLTTGYLHHATDSHQRATVESCANLLLGAASVALGLAFGQVATGFSIFRAYQLLGALLLLYAMIWLFAARGLRWQRPLSPACD